MIKKASVNITEDDIKYIVGLLRSGGHPDIKKPITDGSTSKIVIVHESPKDNPNAMAYVSTDSNDIRFVLPKINQAVASTLGSRDTKGLSVRQIIDAKDDQTREVARAILSLFAGTTGHEIAHLREKKYEGGDTSGQVIELAPESRAEAEGERIMKETINQAGRVSLELKKLAHQLDELGETSFVKDVYRISSLLPKEEVELPKKIAKRDLDTLQKDLEKLFTK